MNKTITINLSGIVFHIDENAYEQLRKYLDKLRGHFSNTQGSDEIIADIESRIAEMFSEKVTESRNVITLEDVNSVITIMGNPEEVAGDEPAAATGKEPQAAETVTTTKTKRRFYRNPDDKILGGVCSGISEYFNIDPIWIRLALVLSVVFAGTGIFIYFILWLIIPEAKTTAEKLEMRGEKVDVSSIEKNVREELEGVKKQMENLGEKLSSDETKHRVRTATQSVGSFFVQVFGKFFSFIGRIIGLVIAVLSITVLIALTAIVFTTAGVFSFSFPTALAHMVLTPSQLIWAIVGGILLVGIPFTMLLLNGIKLLFKAHLNLKKIGFIMLIFWLCGLGICILDGMKIGKEFSKGATVKEHVSLSMNNVYRINLVLTPTESEWKDKAEEFDQFGDAFYLGDKEDSVMIRDVKFNIEKSDNDSVELVVIRNSRGESGMHAHEMASAIAYNYSVTDSTLRLSPAYSIPTSGKYRGQNIRVVLKLPVGKSVFLSKDSRLILHDIDNTTDTWDWDMAGHEWKMTKDGLQCLDCTDWDKHNHKWEWKKHGVTVHYEDNSVRH